MFNKYIRKCVVFFLTLPILIIACRKQSSFPCSATTLKPFVSVAPHKSSFSVGDTLEIKWVLPFTTINLSSFDTIQVQRNLHLNASFGIAEYVTQPTLFRNAHDNFSHLSSVGRYELSGSSHDTKVFKFTPFPQINSYEFRIRIIPTKKGIFGIGFQSGNFLVNDNCIANFVSELVNGYNNIYLRDSITGSVIWSENPSSFYFKVK